MYVVVTTWSEYGETTVNTPFGHEDEAECLKYVMENILPEYEEVEEVDDLSWVGNPTEEFPVGIVISKIES